jgi:ubiquinone/menaquinone biosynthesis C-methylase UbiE
MNKGGIHEKAALGFSSSVEAYERGRPGYSESALSFIHKTIQDLAAGAGASLSGRKLKVLDLGAGTGKFTSLVFEPSSWDLFAVEPIIEMREKLQQKLPSVDAVPGTAEKIPFDDRFFDVVTVAQAFHWFNYELAVQEIARVLRPGGQLILIWNLRDETGASWVSRLSEILDRYEGGVPRFKTMRWKSGFLQSPSPLCEIDHQEFPFEQVGDLRLMRDRVASISFIASLPAADRETALAEMEVVFRSAMNEAGEIHMPYRTHVFVYRA